MNETERNRVWRQANPEKVRARNRRAYLGRLAKLNELRRQPCLVCSESHPAFIMEFHHLRDKVISIVVCANCHAMLDYQRSVLA